MKIIKKIILKVKSLFCKGKCEKVCQKGAIAEKEAKIVSDLLKIAEKNSNKKVSKKKSTAKAGAKKSTTSKRKKP